jgi:hypothetical protein
MDIFSNKRAITGNMWWTLGMTVLAAIVILATFSFFTKLVGLPKNNVGSQEQQGTLANLEIIGNKVQELLESNEDSIGEQDFPYFIGSNFVLVGFDKVWNDNQIVKEGSFFGVGNEKIAKPLDCFLKACLCIYEDTFGRDFNNNPIPLDCYIFDENIIFLGINGEDSNAGYIKAANIKAANEFRGQIISNTYEYLVIYGNELKTAKPFYLHKHKVNDQTYIFISHQDLTIQLVKKS